MEYFNIGDIVGRKSYNKDIMFKIVKINGEMVDLVGVNVRILADSPIYDLVHISEEEMKIREKQNNEYSRVRMNRCYNNINQKFNMRDINNVPNPNVYKKEKILKKPGVILHLDGDSEFSEKCMEVYKKMGITAYVYNVPETQQYKYVYNLLQKLHPNILILTGHDSFYRKRGDMYNLENYKNSKYYIQAVLEARRYEHNLDNLVIFAGACQSYYEAIISAGANFASSPKRVLIDMLDPIIVAESVAYTPVDNFVPLQSIISNTREGLDGIGGVQTRGTYREGMPGI